MINKLLIPEISFDFDTEEEYFKARCSGYIPDYNIARITRQHRDGSSIDYPCHSQEEFVKSIHQWILDDTVKSISAYHAIHYYDINDYD